MTPKAKVPHSVQRDSAVIELLSESVTTIKGSA